MSSVIKQLYAVFDPIKELDRPVLRELAIELKRMGSDEWWAIGEMLERACILLDALSVATRAKL